MTASRDQLTALCLGVVSLCVVFAVQPRHAEARSNSTPEERAQFVSQVRFLESAPLAENASAVRRQLRDWAVAVPDIRFKSCPALLGDAVGADYPYSFEISVQVLLSGAVLTIENPGQARDDAAVYTAGIEGALRTYEALVKSRPDARLAALDDLLEKRDRGELAEHITTLAHEKCRRSNGFLIAVPAGAAVGLLLALLVARRFPGRATLIGRDDAPLDITTRTATSFRGIVLACAAYYIIVGAALHFVEPEYDPRYQFMSDYAWGAYGWLMTTTFFALGVAVLTVAVGIRCSHRSSSSARTGFGLLVVGAVFVCLAGVFRGFPLHDVASAVGIPSLVLAALLLSWNFRTAPGWQVIHRSAFTIAVGMAAAIVTMIVDVGMPGLQQRAFLVLLLVWLSIVVNRLVRIAGGHLGA